MNKEKCGHPRISLRLSGVYTVEAALVMSFVLLLLFLCLFMAFYLHDRTVLNALGRYYLKTLIHMVEEPVTVDGELEAERMEEQNILRTNGFQSAISPDSVGARFAESASRMLLMSNLSEIDVMTYSDEVVIHYKARFKVPVYQGFIELLGVDTRYEATIRTERSLDPEEFVRLCRGIFFRKTQEEEKEEGE